MSELIELYRSPGISDLPITVKSHFARACFLEKQGKREEADAELDLALKAEADLKN